MRVDLGGDRGWLEDPSAKSLARIDKRLGHRLQINEAGRSPEKANENYAAYLAYLNGTGPWAAIALPADKSVHCVGFAIDTDERNTPVLNDHGWYHTVYRNGALVEPWHYEYFPEYDNHRNEVVVLAQTDDGVWRFDVDVPRKITKEDIMAGRYVNAKDGSRPRAILDYQLPNGKYETRTVEEAEVASKLFNGIDLERREYDVAAQLSQNMREEFLGKA